MNNLSCFPRTQLWSHNENHALVHCDRSADNVCLVKTDCGHLYTMDNLHRSFKDKPVTERRCAHCGKLAVPLTLLSGHTTQVQYFREPVLEAACKGKTAELERILNQRPEVVGKMWHDPVCNSEITLLHGAANNGQTSAVKLLLEKGADVEASCLYSISKVYGSSTPLLMAIQSGHIKTVDTLLKGEANVNKPRQFPPLVAAAREGNISIVRLLVNNHVPANVNQGIFGSDEECADIPLLRKCNGITPLMMATAEGYVNIVKYLLQHGADVDATQYFGGSHNGRTALTVAAIHGNVKVGKILVEHGADVNAAMFDAGDNSGSTPLMAAVSCDHVKFTKFLLKNGVNVNATNYSEARKNWTALVYAVNAGSEEIVKLLLEAGANINVGTDCDGEDNTPIAYKEAMENGYINIANILSKHAARSGA